MQGRIGLLLAGTALAIGGGVTGAVVVAPALVDEPAAVGEYAPAGKQQRATRRHTFQVARKARGMARGARQLANGLVEQANGLEGALGEARAGIEQAQSTAAQALNAAGAANSRIDSTEIAFDTASGRVVTGNTTQYVSLPGGPSVTVDVPSSGYIEVWASATFGEDGDASVAADGAIALFEDGQRVPIPNQQGFCGGFAGFDDVLISSEGPAGFEDTLSTPPVLTFGTCGSAGGVPGSLVFKRPPGSHTYQLRYGDCDCDPEPAAFSNRLLQVAPRL